MVISAFAALMAMGGAPKASIMLGKGEHETAEKILGNCASGTIAAGIALTAVLADLRQGAADDVRRQ